MWVIINLWLISLQNFQIFIIYLRFWSNSCLFCTTKTIICEFFKLKSFYLLTVVYPNSGIMFFANLAPLCPSLNSHNVKCWKVFHIYLKNVAKINGVRIKGNFYSTIRKNKVFFLLCNIGWEKSRWMILSSQIKNLKKSLEKNTLHLLLVIWDTFVFF